MPDQTVDDIEQILARVFDEEILRHGFADHLRDYELEVAMHDVQVDPPMERRERWTFTHCVLVEVRTVLSDETWRRSWDDALLGEHAEERWRELGGYLWVPFAVAYPGPTYVLDSTDASLWSERMGRSMHEVHIETNVYELRLIFHRILCDAISNGGSR